MKLKQNGLLFPLLVLGVCAMSSAAFAGSINPGGGGSGDPEVYLGTVNTGFGTVTAGDVVICAFGATCTGTPSASWQSVLVFYDPSNGPFVTDSSADATDAYLFSTIDDSLPTFLDNYDTGVGGADGLSSNYQIIDASSPNGSFTYGDYYFVASSVPEPNSFALAGGVLLLLGFGWRKFARRSAE